MAEEQGSLQERTEEATPKRREDARREGQVARSPELGSGAVLGSALLVFLVAGPWMREQMSSYLGQRLQAPATLLVDVDSAPQLLREGAALVLLVLAPLLLAVAAAGLLANLGQVGLLFTGKPVTPSWSRLNPVKGLAQLFSLRSLAELGKSLLKVTLVGLAVWLVLGPEVPRLGQLAFLPLTGVLPMLAAVVLRLGIWVLVMLLALAALDVVFQRWDLARRLRMTVQEIREEFKQTEGDPLLKRRQRGIQLETAYNRMIRELPRADVVVTNPVHLAVALQYQPGSMRAPRVLAKGRRLVAERIKEIAREHGIPVVENVPLARALFKSCAVGDEIPGELYRAVAELLAFVFRLKRRSA